MVKVTVDLVIEVMLIVVVLLGLVILLARLAGGAEAQTSVLFTETQIRTTAVLKEIATLQKRGYRCQWAKPRQYQCDPPPAAPQPDTPIPSVESR